MRSRVFAGWLCSGIATACTPVDRPPDRDPAPGGSEPTTIDPHALDGRRFVSVGVKGATLLPNTRVRLHFADDGGFQASAGCNSLRSEVVGVSTGVLDVYRPHETQKACGEALHEQDRWLGAFIAGKPAWSLEGSRLTLRSEGVTIVLIDEPRPDP